MKFQSLLLASLMTLFFPALSHASYTDYCKGTHTTSAEDGAIQRLVAQFGNAMGCEIGDNCLLKWDINKNSEKFSIAWKSQCGPVIKGVHQLGDEGHGSTFVCKKSVKNSVCCWPLGYEHKKQFTVCSGKV